MRREPGFYNAYVLFGRIADRGWDAQAGLPDGRYVPARPLGGMNGRLKMAWMVFTGRADVLHWPGQE